MFYDHKKTPTITVPLHHQNGLFYMKMSNPTTANITPQTHKPTTTAITTIPRIYTMETFPQINAIVQRITNKAKIKQIDSTPIRVTNEPLPDTEQSHWGFGSTDTKNEIQTTEWDSHTNTKDPPGITLQH